MTTTEIHPNQTPIGGFGLSVNGSDQNGTNLVFGKPPSFSTKPAARGLSPQESYPGTGRRGSALSFLGGNPRSFLTKPAARRAGLPPPLSSPRR